MRLLEGIRGAAISAPTQGNNTSSNPPLRRHSTGTDFFWKHIKTIFTDNINQIPSIMKLYFFCGIFE